LDIVFKIAPISDRVTKFRGDRPRDRGDLALNKRKKQQQNKGLRVALSQRAALIMPVSATRELIHDFKRNTCKIYSADLVGMAQYEHDEYFQSKKWGDTLHCVPPALKK